MPCKQPATLPCRVSLVSLLRLDGTRQGGLSLRLAINTKKGEDTREGGKRRNRKRAEQRREDSECREERK